MPGMPSIGEVNWVNPKLILAVSRAALADPTAASLAVIWAVAVATWARRLQLRLGGQVVLGGVVEILLRDCLLLRERRVPVDVEPCSSLVGCGDGDLGFGLFKLSV